MKHVGKMKNNSARVAVVYRTLPGDPHSALVIGTNGLTDAYHDGLMSLLESDSGQQANELADILAVRRFPDGNVMLNYLHAHGHLKKVPTHMVIMTPNTQNQIPLDELNQIIAQQKGISIDELAVTDGQNPNPKAKKPAEIKTTSQDVSGEIEIAEPEPTTPAAMRSKADALFKQAQILRKQADAIDPPKPRTKKVKAEA